MAESKLREAERSKEKKKRSPGLRPVSESSRLSFTVCGLLVLSSADWKRKVIEIGSSF